MSIRDLWHKVCIFGILAIQAGLFSGDVVNGQDANDEHVFRDILPAVVRVTGYMRSAPTDNVYRKHAETSGFFYEPEGFLFTLYSVYVEPEAKRFCEKFEVNLFDGRLLDAYAIAVDPVSNLAILKMSQDDDYPVLDIRPATDNLSGEEVWAIAGKQSENEIPWFSGRLKAKEKTSIYGEGAGDLLIDTYLELPDYAYGGLLVNRNGEILGINILDDNHAASDGQATGEEHALPISAVSIIYKLLMANPTFDQKWLGVSTRNLKMEERAAVKQAMQRQGGVFVDFVWKEGPAANTGIRPGDILVGINGHRIMTNTHFNGLLFRTESESTTELMVVRNGQVFPTQVRVEKRPPWAAL